MASASGATQMGLVGGGEGDLGLEGPQQLVHEGMRTLRVENVDQPFVALASLF